MTVSALFALLIAAVALAIPYSSLFSSPATPSMSLSASLHTSHPVRASIPVVHSVAPNDPQSARIAQASARESYNATMLQAKIRRQARAKARAKIAAEAQASQPAAAATTQAPAPTPSAPAPVAQGNPEQTAEGMMGSYGWDASQFTCLLPLWMRESGWNPFAENSGSGAYGIPQALPGSKMASAGADWQTNATTQIIWGLQYLKSVYGSPCGGWAHEQEYGWY